MDWAESIKMGDSPRKREGWRRKENVNEEQQQQIEEHLQMKIQQQNEKHRQMKIKKWNEEQLTSRKTPRSFSKECNIAGSFWLSPLKNDYRSLISITFISNIVFHMMAISIFNKDNG